MGEALDIDPVTVARRWQRLSSAGIAWVSGRATGQGRPESCLAVVELSCSAGPDPRHRRARHRAAARAQRRAHERAGSLTILVEVRDLAFLSRFLLESVGTIPGVVATSSHAVTKVYSMGDHWQLHVLDPSQQAVMLRAPHPRLDGLTSEQTDLARGYDAGRPPADPAPRVRTDACPSPPSPPEPASARARSGGAWPTSSATAGSSCARHGPARLGVARHQLARGPHADAGDVDAIAMALRRLPGIRVCWRISGGQPNLMLALTTHSLHELSPVEARAAAEVPRMTIHDRSMVLRSIKRMGRELDLDGRSIRSVPLDIWADAAGRQSR